MVGQHPQITDRLLGLSHAVSDSVFSEDVRGAAGVVTQFLTEAPHIGAQHLWLAQELRSPDPLQQFILSQDASGLSGKFEEQVVLRGGQLHLVSRHGHHAPLEGERHPTSMFTGICPYSSAVRLHDAFANSGGQVFPANGVCRQPGTDEREFPEQSRGFRSCYSTAIG